MQIKEKSIINKCKNLFYLYNQNQIGVFDLIDGLKDIEKKLKEKKRGINLWFKFGENDTLATTIENLKSYLNLPYSHINRKFIEEQIGMIVDDPNSKLIVFLS